MSNRLSLTYIFIRECLAQGPRPLADIVEYVRPRLLLGVGFRAAERHRLRQRADWRPGDVPVARRNQSLSLYDQHLIGVRLIVGSRLQCMVRCHTVEKLPDGTFKWIR